jgi:hypothetical protein
MVRSCNAITVVQPIATAVEIIFGQRLFIASNMSFIIMQTVLQFALYPVGAVLNRSDLITVPEHAWFTLRQGHVEKHNQPIVVNVQIGKTRHRPLVARVRLAGISEKEDEHLCFIPEWIWHHLGTPDIGTFLTLTTTIIPRVDRVVLRQRGDATDDLDLLLDTLMRAVDGGVKWAVLCVGAKIPLWCGTFDVVGLKMRGEVDVAAGCILDLRCLSLKGSSSERESV